MNNLFNFPSIPDASQMHERDCNALIEDYLEHLIAPLIGIVPYPERLSFRQEAHAHIDGLILDFQYKGEMRAEATEHALREFGEPWKLGQAFLEEWSQGGTGRPSVRLARKAAWTAFGSFGAASMLTLLMLEKSAFTPFHELPLGGIGMLALFSPWIAGGFVGAMTPTQAKRGITHALCVLIPHSCAVGALMPPGREVLLFAAWQLLFWLPAGWGSAALTAACLRQMRRQHFWLTAR